VVQDTPEQVTGVEEGQVLFGKYRIERLLGVGGMGAVVAAQHLQLDTTVAIKFLLPAMLESEEAVARFAREARAAVLMNNEHVARIFDVGTLASGAPYMVMEFLDGTDLGSMLQQKGPLPIKEAVDYVLQACEAVAEAHSLGIVHRDLKPANLYCIVRPDGRRVIKVLDFGISKITGSASWPPPDSLTRAVALMGTPLYMSPEQIETPQTVDARTDIWALGIVLYELLSGKAPFNGNTLPQVSVKIAVRAPPPLSEFRPDAPTGLAAVIDRCLEKDREKRFPHVAELALALLPFGTKRARALVERIAEISESAGLCTIEMPPPESLGPTSHALAREPAPASEPSKSAHRGRRLVAVGTTLAVGVASVVLWSVSATAPATSDRSAAAPDDSRAVSAPQTSAALAVEPPRLASVATPTASDSSLRTPVAGTSASAPLAATASAPSAPAAATVSSTLEARRTVAVQRPAMNAPARAPVKAGCDPNFEIDELGRKHFKAECLVGSAPLGVRAGGKTECEPNFDIDERGRKHFKAECFAGRGR
jgi:serine/threonine protein kinase